MEFHISKLFSEAKDTKKNRTHQYYLVFYAIYIIFAVNNLKIIENEKDSIILYSVNTDKHI